MAGNFNPALGYPFTGGYVQDGKQVYIQPVNMQGFVDGGAPMFLIQPTATAWIGIDDIKYSTKLDGAEYVYGVSRIPVGDTMGQWSFHCTATLMQAQMQRLQWELSGFGAFGWGDTRFNIYVSSTVAGQIEPVVDYIIGCRLSSDDFDIRMAGGANKSSIDLRPWAIARNGLFPTAGVSVQGPTQQLISATRAQFNVGQPIPQ